MEQQVLFEVAPPPAPGHRQAVAPERAAAAVIPGGVRIPGHIPIPGPLPGPLPGPPLPGLDAAQAAVVGHRGGPLLVLAGPGTGRSTALVAAVAARLRPGPARLPGERVLVLTSGGRRAAMGLREAIAAQSGVSALPLVTTFHALAHWVMRDQGDPDGPPLRLLTAPEQEARLRELLSGAVSEGRLAWPVELRAALGTRGIGHEVRGLLARARGLGLDGPGLAGLGRRAGVPAWRAVGSFLDEYLDTLDFEGVIDYSELMFRAMVLAHKRREGAALRGRFDLIVVDEYQDVEPVGVALLQALASQGADLIVAGDPDMALYGFRGSQHGAVPRFPARFADPSGQPAPVVVLTEQHRVGANILAAARRVLAPVTLAPLPAALQRSHRGGSLVDDQAPLAHPGAPDADGGTADQVGVEVYPSAREQAAGIADRLVRAHASGLRWSEMAVVVRSAGPHLELLRAQMGAAGIPAWLRIGEPPLSRQPAVEVLMHFLAAAISRARGTQWVPGSGWDGASLLSSPIGAADPLSVHLLSRALAGPALTGPALTGPVGIDAAGSEGGGTQLPNPSLPNPSVSDALGWALAEPERCARLVSVHTLWSPPQLAALREAVAAVARVSAVLQRAADSINNDGQPQEVLWALWSGTDWPERLREQALSGGPVAARAHSALDAVIELFDLAGRFPAALRGQAGAQSLHEQVSGQDVPIQLRAGAQRHPDAVAICSVHQARGNSWPLVVVGGVQEGSWPDLRHRVSLLATDELGATGAVAAPGVADRLAAERRLMYVACTRASSQLVVTAVDDAAAGVRPSRFIAELGVEVSQRRGPLGASATTSGVLRRLRALLGHDDDSVRQAAALRLAGMAGQSGPEGIPLFPGSDPAGWWFARPVTGAAPEPAASGVGSSPVRLSASTLAGLQECPLRWFLQRRAGAAAPTTAAMALGRLMHSLADQLAHSGPVADDEQAAARVAELQARAHREWAQVPCAGARESQVLRARADRMIATLVAWHRRNPRQVLASEWAFDVGVATDCGPVRLVGAVDRIDRDDRGGLHVIDFKTSRTPVSKAAAEHDPQLAVYQLALANSSPTGGPGPVAGAELVYLDKPSAGGQPTVRSQEPLTAGGWALDLVGRAGQMLREQRFPARPGAPCLRCRFTDICPAGKEPEDDSDQ